MSFSQNNEEEIVRDYFAGRPGRLLDIGANDGVTYSNSYALLQAGWTGVLIEPSLKASTRLKELYKDRKGIDCLHFGIAETTGTFEFHESGPFDHQGGDIGLLSTLEIAEKARWGSRVAYETGKAWFMSFADFLDACGQRNIRKFEFISIDAEGYDWKILQQIDLDQVGCQCLCIEHNGKQDLLALFRGHCSLFGLQQLSINAENIIFAR